MTRPEKARVDVPSDITALTGQLNRLTSSARP
jgi:hypothetical protein